MMASDAFEQITQLIGQKIGLRPHTVSRVTWEWILKERMTLLGILTFEEYLKKLQSSSQEVQELIELVIVPETWFFRDKGVYDFLGHFIEKEWNSRFHGQVLKILSLACSTGEEPYSIAMTLLDKGIPKNRFSIDALDISKKGLAKAQIGIYRKNSFRGKDLAYRSHYFTETETGYALKSTVKELVHFYYCNLLENHIPLEARAYHLIFFRNLLIYLDGQSQQSVFHLVKKLLVPHGYVIVGSAETQIARHEGFVPKSFSRAYVFSLDDPNLNKISVKTTQQAFGNLIKNIRNQKEVNNKKMDHVDSHPTIDSLDADEKAALIEEAAKLADSGCFEESTNLCLKYINKFGANSQIYYLLGLMQHATGHEVRAEEFFYKTVYLQPSHYEALIYLALLSEKKGDTHQAELFRERAQKIHKVK